MRARKTSGLPTFNVVPDKLDLRDRIYQPSIANPPSPQLLPKTKLPVLDQKRTSACTGFALANLVNFLIRRAGKGWPKPPVSPFMLYSMARRYDEFPGSAQDTGSSLRGAMKGWYKHGACAEKLWRTVEMPPPASSPHRDWWLDAARRPLGAYYRVATQSVTDMHVALREVGVLYASSACHRGWLKGFEANSKGQRLWRIPSFQGDPGADGHAFIIIGYTERGFVIQNSWGIRWGSQGLALLAYEDWLANAMDCWVAQLGVVTEQHNEIASASSLRMVMGRVQLATDEVLRNREIAPFIINMENNGRLSASGMFRTNQGDVDALVTLHVEEALQQWGLKAGSPFDVAIYAHGGLTGEDDAAKTASLWIPALYQQQVFPIFFLWETDLWSTLKNRFADWIAGLPKPTRGLRDQLTRFWNRRLERLLAPVGSVIWDEMKQNADAISAAPESHAGSNGKLTGARLLYQCCQKSKSFQKGKVRIHLIGHSAGAIVHSHLVNRLAQSGWRFESVNFMAPAVRVDLFEQTVLPAIESGVVGTYRQFHLTDSAEEQDPTCRPLLGYNRSLLYLVSESFEHGIRTPILGMEKHLPSWMNTSPQIRSWAAPSLVTASTTHGGFDNDEATMRNIIGMIRRKP
ncbi:MAG: C1 family peptidase [Acidobacteriota bacterium]